MSKKIGDISDAFRSQRTATALTRALMGGTAAMRLKGEKYLPKKSGETPEEYRARLEAAVLVNYFGRTVDYLAGQVFSKPVEYQSPTEGEAPAYDEEFFAAFADNVDLCGNDLHKFCIDVFTDALIDGVSYVMADFPHIGLTRGEGGGLYLESGDGPIPWTSKVAAQVGARPYLVEISLDKVLDAWTRTVNGRKVLSLFIYEEAAEIADGDDLSRRWVRDIRILRPGSWELWRIDDNGGGAYLLDSGATSLDYVPVFAFLPGNEKGNSMTADPPLADLAEMNRAHWAAYSDHRKLMSWNCNPIWLAINCIDPENKNPVIGPSRMMAVTSTEGVPSSLESVGVNPESVDRSQADLKSMTDYMESYGLQVALAPVGNVTATQVNTVTNSSDSQLKGMCAKFVDCMENALRAVAQYQAGSLDADGPAIVVNTVFRMSFDANLAALLRGLAENGKLSIRTLLHLFKQMGIFNDEFDPDKEADELKKQEATALPSLK